jgi:hypothetical protein
MKKNKSLRSQKSDPQTKLASQFSKLENLPEQLKEDAVACMEILLRGVRIKALKQKALAIIDEDVRSTEGFQNLGNLTMEQMSNLGGRAFDLKKMGSILMDWKPGTPIPEAYKDAFNFKIGELSTSEQRQKALFYHRWAIEADMLIALLERIEAPRKHSITTLIPVPAAYRN